MEAIKSPGAPADRSGGVALERAFGTWSSDHPLAMTYLPLGLTMTPVAYAASTGKATTFPAGAALRLGRHSADASLVEAALNHAGTEIDWRYVKAEPFAVQGGWTATRFAEWGLRFWVCLALGSADGNRWHWNAELGAAVIRVGHRFGILLPDRLPLLVTGHDDLSDLTDELEQHGYFYLASRIDEAPLLALRFNLEEAPSARFAFAVGDDLADTVARAHAALTIEPDLSALPRQTGAGEDAIDAVRDIMAWNTLFDPVNTRRYTALSRNWTTAKFGGFGVWLNDVLFSAALCATVDAESARDNLLAVLAGATPQGNLPCLLTGNDAWIDRSQPPIGAYVLMMLHLRWPDRALLSRVVPVLLRAYDWWWRARDPHGTGLVAYGTSAVGAGLYRGTKLGAKDESAMDNSPTHDAATLDPATGLLDSHDVGLNSLLALEGEMLVRLLAELGRNAEASALSLRVEAHKAAIRDRLWDQGRGVFANRLTSGHFVQSLAPTSFYPLLAGIPTADQTQALLVQLHDPRGFGGPYRLPSTRRDDPAFGDNIYWRGRVWPPMNWLTWAGLRRAGLVDEAAALAQESHALFRKVWDGHRHAAENFSATTGAATDQPDTDTFYAWSALMPAMAVAEVTDVTPWEGFSLTNGADVDLGPVATPCGPCRIVVRDGTLRLVRSGSVLLETGIPGRLTQLELSPRRLGLRLPAGAPDGWIRIPATALPLMAVQGGKPVDTMLDGGMVTLHTRAVTHDNDREIDVVLP